MTRRLDKTREMIGWIVAAFFNALPKLDRYIERVLVSVALGAMAILLVAIAWGVLEGRYSLILPYRS